MSEAYVAIQTVMLPKDTNPHGTIFGGVLLANIDMAGAIGAQREVQLRGGNSSAAFVTVAINRVEFKKPVLVGDVAKMAARIKPTDSPLTFRTDGLGRPAEVTLVPYYRIAHEHYNLYWRIVGA